MVAIIVNANQACTYNSLFERNLIVFSYITISINLITSTAVQFRFTMTPVNF